MKLKAIIVDDEQHSLQSTELLVQKNCPGIEIIGLVEYIRGEGGELIMSNGDEVIVSRNKKDELLKFLTR